MQIIPLETCAERDAVDSPQKGTVKNSSCKSAMTAA